MTRLLMALAASALATGCCRPRPEPVSRWSN